MMKARRRLSDLAACLRGSPPPDADWLGIIEDANRSLVTPALAARLRPEACPEDVAAYLRLIFERNAARNTRLQGQLDEVASCLNAAGIVPTLIKGAAWLRASPPERIGERMLTDLDIIVPAENIDAAMRTLAATGFQADSEIGEAHHHFKADLFRSSDAAMVDLHVRPPGPARLHPPARLPAHSHPFGEPGCTVNLPDATSQAFHVLVHDLLHDGDFWAGRIDLRHLVDLDFLSREPGFDWDRIQHWMQAPLDRIALATQCVALSELLGTRVPESLLEMSGARLQHVRRMLQLDHPRLQPLLTAATVLAHGRSFLWPKARNDIAAGLPQRRRTLRGQIDRLRQIISKSEAGKV
jgi:hypothetical protein